MELPAQTGSEDYVITLYRNGGSSTERNYTFNYSKERYAALWTAYTLTESDILETRATGSWAYYEGIGSQYQVNVKANSYGTNYNNDTYSRGHQIPDADRRIDADKAQTYYLTNQTPQIQNGFNSGVWSQLEKAGRGFVVSSGDNYNSSFTRTDVLYVVTGPCYGKSGTSETPSYLTAASTSITPSRVPIPKYYWKAFLKVKRDSNGNVTSAKAIGFWFEHKTYSDSYTDHVVSVDQIETWTGFDLFTNLPGTQTSGIEQSAESNTTWTAFRDF